MPQPIVMAQIGNLKFGVTEDQAKAFAKAWDSGGIKMILDATSISFANAWANIAIKSALESEPVQMAIFQHVYAKLKAVKTGPTQVKAAVPTQVDSAPVLAKSLITLTDA